MLNAKPPWSIAFLNDGGPLIVLPREIVKYWNQDQRPLPMSPHYTWDYQRAVETKYPAELIKVGPGFGLVPGSQEPIYAANWLQFPEESGIVLVGWGFADDGSEDKVIELLHGNRLDWSRAPETMIVRDGVLVLMHAACVFDELRQCDPFGDKDAVINDAISIHIEPGQYAVESVGILGNPPQDAFNCVLCRWIPLGSIA